MKKVFGLFKNKKMFALRMIVIMAIALAVAVSPKLLLDVQAVGTHPSRVVDEADLLTTEEEKELLAQVDEISERQQFDVVIVTLNSLNGEDIQYYAADYYDYNGYGMGENYDGAMFIMSMEEREWFILTTGYGIDVLTDREIDSIGENVASCLSAEEYFTGFSIFAEEVDMEVEYGAEYGQGSGQQASPSILISIFIGLVLGLIPAFIMRGKLKSVHMQTSAGGYEDRGSRNLTVQQDIFLYHTVNRVPRPKENSGNRGGGSSTFRGSSGRSHGGRGGGF